jgi:uncharacterized membrane protein
LKLLCAASIVLSLLILIPAVALRYDFSKADISFWWIQTLSITYVQWMQHTALVLLVGHMVSLIVRRELNAEERNQNRSFWILTLVPLMATAVLGVTAVMTAPSLSMAVGPMAGFVSWQMPGWFRLISDVVPLIFMGFPGVIMSGSSHHVD